MPKIAVCSCRPLVQQRIPFKCHGSLYAEHTIAQDGTRMYVVYSYGEHWPLFVHHDGVWYENEGRYSVTTSKHRSMSHPLCATQLVACDALKRFVRRGVDCHPSVAPLVAVSV